MQALKKLWGRWKELGKAIGDRVGRVVMTVFYFTVVAPFGLAVRLLSDPLQLRSEPPRWALREEQRAPALEDARRTY